MKMGVKSIAMASALAMALGVVGAGTAAAQDTATTGSQAGTTDGKDKKADPSRRVCRTVVISGSRLGERHCRPAADWEADAEHARKELRDTQTNGYRRDGEMNGNGMLGRP